MVVGSIWRCILAIAVKSTGWNRKRDWNNKNISHLEEKIMGKTYANIIFCKGLSGWDK